MPGVGFAILAYVVVNANIAAQRLGLAWLALGVVVLAGLYLSGRRPALSGLAPAQPQARRRGAGVTAMDTITYRPARDELAYTFGGRMPVAHVRSGDVLQVHTEDCFGGLVRGPADLPSQVCRMPYLNPVSGPFFVEDAEPGDTLAVHLAAIVPARDWGVSSTFPHFGALTSTSHTATLQPPLEERVWVYDIDRQAGTVRLPRHAQRPHASTCRWTR